MGNAARELTGHLYEPVHPHRRGERSATSSPRSRNHGSSPQAWGTRPGGRRLPRHSRFIPTGVGNAVFHTLKPHSVAVHPHRRGERLFILRNISLSCGSSPQAWGTPPLYWHDGAGERFIPTGVGNAIYSRWPRSELPVHPHRRGERQVRERHQGCGDGSSPQAWGTHKLRIRFGVTIRFIPTGVGNAIKGAKGRKRRRGSSPQAWGTPRQCEALRRAGRFIPTGVGNAIFRRLKVSIEPVHPHRRGERYILPMAVAGIAGSSPQAWGTHLSRFGADV